MYPLTHRYDPHPHTNAVVKTGVISQAAGSAYVELAKTKVMCGVYGPRQPQRVDGMEFGRGRLDVDVKLATFATAGARAGKVRERRREARRLERPRVPAAEAADAKVAAVLAARRAAEEADTHTTAADDGVDGKVPVGGPEEMYGKEGAARVAALEAELNAAYDDAVDRRKPRHWPAIALNPIDT